MKIYTKTGDTGETGLFRGDRVAKHHPRVEAYGAVDELNALLGVVLTNPLQPEISLLLGGIQHELFDIGADLATPPQNQNDATYRIDPILVENLETAIDRFEAQLPMLTQFILPGGTPAGAQLHFCRTVCRRAERAATFLQSIEPMNPEVIRYLNRLSDLLFVLARFENHCAKTPEVQWKKS